MAPGGRGFFSVVASLALACVLCTSAYGGEVRYDYDLLGRLVRAIHPDGRVIEYVYDPAGNLLRVINSGTAQVPAITALSRNSVRRGEVRQIVVTGTGLAGISVSASDAGISVRTLAVSAASVTLSVGVDDSVPLGAHTLFFRNAAGTTQATLDVLPAIAFTILPESVAVPPDSVARQFTLALSEPEDADFTFSTATLDTAIARAAPASFTIAAGQTQATFSVAGLAAGTTNLTLSAPSLLHPLGASIFVDPAFASANVRYSRALGLVKGDPTHAAGTSGPHVSPPLGLVKGDPTRAPGTSGPHIAPPLGIVKGDPTTPPLPFNKGPVLSPPLGLQKP